MAPTVPAGPAALAVAVAAAVATFGTPLGRELPLALVLAGLVAPRRWRAPVVLAGLVLLRTSAPGAAEPLTLSEGAPRVVRGEIVLRSPWSRTAGAWRAGVRFRERGGGSAVEGRLSVGGVRKPPPGGRFDIAGFATPRGLQTRIHVPSFRLLVGGRDPAPLRIRAVQGLRRRWQRALGADRERREPLVRGLLYGESQAVPEPWARSLRRVGAGHVLALSGLHVGLVAALAWVLAPGGRRVRLVSTLCGLAAYLMVADPSASLRRAATAGVLLSVAGAVGRPIVPLQALSVAAGGMLWVRPEWWRDLGFCLSVGACAGIALCARGGQGRPAGRSVRVSVGALIGSWPAALPAFGLFAPAAVLANPVAVAWVTVALAAVLVWAMVGLWVPPAAAALAPGLDLLAWPLELWSRAPVGFWGAVPVTFTGPEAAALAIGAGTVVVGKRGFRVAGIALLLLWGTGGRPSSTAELRMLNVGQGEAILVRDGRVGLLVDGGGWRGGDVASTVLLPALGRAGVRRLDGVVVTHGDHDHCSGALALSELVAVRSVRLAPGAGGPCVESLMARKGVRILPIWHGHRWSMGRWRFEALAPPPGLRRGGNDGSVVLRAEFDRHSILLTGDIEHRGEERLVRRAKGRLAAGFLKIPHHGAAGSAYPALLWQVRPRVALVSAGRSNRYGHPASSTLRRLRSRGIAVWRTDLHGEIRLKLEPGGGWRIESPPGRG